jgi:hypothetical protein
MLRWEKMKRGREKLTRGNRKEGTPADARDTFFILLK